MDAVSEQETKSWEAVQTVGMRWMFVLSFILLGTVFALQGIGVIQSPEQTEGKQRSVQAGGLRCDEPVWNFGEVDSVKNPRLTHEFVLVNESNETVSVKKVRSSCGCMVVGDYDSELPPGGGTELQVVLQLPTVPQRVSYDLAVQTDKGVLPLGVFGTVVVNRGLYTVPAVVSFGTVRPGEMKERSVRVIRYDLSPIESVTVQYPQGMVYAVEQPPYMGSGVVVRLQFTPNSAVPEGRFNEFIVISTLDGSAPDLLVPVFAVVQEDRVDVID